jgi:hypothetical protein
MILSGSALIYIYITYQNIYNEQPITAQLLILLWFLISWSLIITLSVSFYEILFKVINKKDERKDLKENINDFYKHKKLSEPPDTQMYN